jgi:hypothetical protein
MQILERRTYRGPNLYAHFPVIRLNLDLGELEDHPSATIPGFVDALIAALPTLKQHTCSYGEEGGFIRRMREDGGTWLGHVLEHVAIEVQVLTGAKVTFGKTRGTGVAGQYFVVYEYEEERVGEAAGNLALDLLHSLLPGEFPRRARRSRRLQLPGVARRADRLRPAPPVRPVDGLAGPRRREARHPVDPPQRPVARAVRPRPLPEAHPGATVTSETRHIAVEIASDKEETNRILGDLGLPVPRQYVVRNAERAVQSAERLGYPVVVKPLDANHGRGVSINLETERRRARRLREGPGALVARSSSRPTSPASTTACWCHRRPPDRRRQARARPRRRRRRADDRAARRPREPGPAPRHRPREGPDPHRARLPGQAPARAARHDPRDRARPRAKRSTCARPATSAPAAPRST